MSDSTRSAHHLGQRGREGQRFGTLRLLPIALAAEARPTAFSVSTGS